MSHRPHPNRERALHQLGRHATPSLESLTAQELVARATSRLGGPTPDEIAEAARRIRILAQKIAPAFSALQTIGLKDAS